ncbi:MAG: cation transporter [Acidimicrobiales bacterium]
MECVACADSQDGPWWESLRAWPPARSPWSASASTPTSRSLRRGGLWRLSKERHGDEISEAAEHRALRIIAGTFFALAAGVTVESIRKLATGEHPSVSPAGIALTVVSLIVMPLLARAKRDVGRQLGSNALQADATETVLRVWLSAIVLGGLVLNAAFGWWWADPVAALGIVYVAAREGREAWKGRTCC